MKSLKVVLLSLSLFVGASGFASSRPHVELRENKTLCFGQVLCCSSVFNMIAGSA